MKLKNGSEEPDAVVMATIITLKELQKSDYTSFFDLVDSCRNKGRVPFGDGGRKLHSWGLFQSDHKTPHTAVKNIVLSFVTGDLFNMKLTSPERNSCNVSRQ